MRINDFILYRYLSTQPLLVAVAGEYEQKIEHALMQFGSFEAVPHDWEVRGIFLETSAGETPDFDSDAQQSEVVISNLRYYPGLEKTL